jgi:hypothetical protein
VGAVGRVFAAVVGWSDTTVAALGGPVRGDSAGKASQRERASYFSDPLGVRLAGVASSEIVPVSEDGYPWWSVAKHLLGAPPAASPTRMRTKRRIANVGRHGESRRVCF